MITEASRKVGGVTIIHKRLIPPPYLTVLPDRGDPRPDRRPARIRASLTVRTRPPPAGTEPIGPVSSRPGSARPPARPPRHR
jgi:hypothetical protein